MQVKTNTKEKFHVIKVEESSMSADMAAKLNDLLVSYLQNDVRNIILNLKELKNIDEETGEMIVKTQQKFYDNNASCVICEMQKPVEEFLDSVNLLEMINSTPTESEASDIIQMEEIERELMDDDPLSP